MRHTNFEAISLFAETALLRDVEIFKDQLSGGRGKTAELIQVSSGHTGLVEVHKKGRHAVVFQGPVRVSKN